MDIKALIAQMTLEEKASLLSGLDFWHTKPVERLNIPSVMVSDGPHGLRKQDMAADHAGINDSIKAVCFPAGCASASSFDRDLLKRLGEAIGEACQHEALSVILGPAVNIKRSPLCGRNFEYYSEDPYLAGDMAASFIEGVQSKNVGTSMKHYAANNQECRRMSVSTEADERTLREIYLPAFEHAVKKAQPWTIMNSYNRINGEYVGESRKYLTEILREEWGFEGLVVSDWGAVNDRVAAVRAGLDLEMPASMGINDKKVVAAVKEGALAEADVDLACERVLALVYKFIENAKPDTAWELEAQHALACDMAAECAVLLKNKNGLLPLNKADKVALIGEFAQKPRYQGGGSSHINSFKVVSALDALKDNEQVTYAKGFFADRDETTDEMVLEAVNAAKNAKVAVIFAGLPDSFESEGYDRTHMRMPDCQNRVISEVVKVNPNTVVVLHNGSPVEMPWADEVSAILEVYLGGQAVGEATAKLLYGDKNPCGRLQESFPIKLEDNPSYLTFGGADDKVSYNEGVFVGYRYYDKKNMPVRFPFGFGLSYTEFEYSNLKLDKNEMLDTDSVIVSVDVKNIGKRAGKEVVQLYVGDVKSTYPRPVRELKGFEKITLEPGEKKTVTFKLCKRAFAYWNEIIHDWHVETGEFLIEICRSSRDVALSAPISVKSTVKIPKKFHVNSTFGDIMNDENGRKLIAPFADSITGALAPTDDESDVAKSAVSREMMAAMLRDMPLRSMVSFSGGKVDEETLNGLIAALNNN